MTEQIEQNDDSITVGNASPEAPSVAPAPVVAEDAPQDDGVSVGSDPEPDREPAGAPDTDYNLTESLPEYLPRHLRDDPSTEDALTELAPMLKDKGVQASKAKLLTGLFADMYLEQDGRIPDLHDKDTMENYLRSEWGEHYDKMVHHAQRSAQWLGPQFITWLERTQLGNHPGMLALLVEMDQGGLLRGDLSAADAGAALKKMRDQKDNPVNRPGAKGRSLQMASYRILAAIAGMGDQSASDGDASERRSERDGRQVLKDRRSPPEESSPRVKAETEARSLMRSEAWNDKRNPAHRATAERVRELFRLAWPEGKD
jgi:hypothetical protein